MPSRVPTLMVCIPLDRCHVPLLIVYTSSGTNVHLSVIRREVSVAGQGRVRNHVPLLRLIKSSRSGDRDDTLPVFRHQSLPLFVLR